MIWKTAKLGEVCKIINGSTPLRSRKDFWELGTIPWFTIDDLRKQGRDIKYTNQKITRLALEKTSIRMLPKDTVLLCCTASIGASAIARVEMATNQQFNGLIPNKEKLIPEFLYYISTTITQKLINLSGSATINFIAISKLKEIEIFFPSVLEQQRIVAKLDAVFAEIDKIKKLEETKLKKNETLIQNFIDKIFKDNKNLHKLSDCTQINPPKSEVNDLDDAIEVSFMPMKDIEINNKLAIPKQKRKLKDVKSSYTYFSEGDILLAKITPCFENGKMGIASNLLNGIGFGSSEYIVFRPNKNLKNDWLYYFLNRKSFRIDGAQNMSGAVGHKRVNKDFIGNTLIPISSVEEQEKILLTLKNLSNHSKAINKIILKKKDEMSYLKKSILNKLLSNKLVDAA